MTDPERESTDHPDNDPDGPHPAVPVSRTQRKRQALHLQSLGAELVDLDPGDLARIPLPDELTDAIALYRRIHSREARRRQLQLIGKLMRSIDVDPIGEALERLRGHSARARYEFRELENWREKLIAEDGALTDYLSAHPRADRQRLRHQIAKVRRAGEDGQRKAESRALFRLLREIEEAHRQSGQESAQ